MLTVNQNIALLGLTLCKRRNQISTMKILGFYGFATAGILLAIVTQAQDVIVPGNFASTEGDSNNGYPFNISAFSLTSQRYQQVYNSSLFSSLPAGGVEITGMAFRIDVGTGASFSSTLPDIQIDLSTTATSANTLSSTFASNVGANDTVVVGAGPLALSGTTGGTPNPFNIIINFTTPFIYDPSAGNLLMDVHNFGGGGTTQFDSTDVGTGIARNFTEGSGVGSPTADGVINSSGLITEFIYQPVPEPGTLALAGLGGLTMLLGFRRRKLDWPPGHRATVPARQSS